MTDFLAGNGTLWVQPDGPNTMPVYLGEHGIGDITKPKGDATTVHVASPMKPNKFIPWNIYRGEPGAITFSVDTGIKDIADWLETIECPVPMYIGLVACGRKDVWSNYSRLFIIEQSMITSENMSGVVIRDPANQGESVSTFDVSALAMHKIIQTVVAKLQIAGTTGRTSQAIRFVNQDRCYGTCGSAVSPNQVGYLGLVGLLGTPTNAYLTINGGKTWLPCAGNPFMDTEDVIALETMMRSATAHRVIAARGTADLLNYAEIAYSDDGGTTWTNINVGAVVGQYAIGRNSLWAVNPDYIYHVTTGGYIYQSKNAGATWTALHSGTLTINDLYCVHFSDDRNGVAAGANNTMLITKDGQNWTILTGPAAEGGNICRTVAVLDAEHFWVGYSSGRLYYTNDAGATWFERVFPGYSTGQIYKLDFVNDYVGYMLHLSAGGAVSSVFRTVNGGATWENFTLPAGTGVLRQLTAIDCNLAYFC